MPFITSTATDVVGCSYWDWSVDWQNLTGSSIWNDEDGFGGPGIEKANVLSDGQCVSGPFQNVTLLNFNYTIRPHCLSRQFHHFESRENETLWGRLVRPEAMGQLDRSEDYGSLRYMLEMQMHNVIHNGVEGDLVTWSSANGKLLKQKSIFCSGTLNKILLQIPSSGFTMPNLIDFGGNGSRKSLNLD